MQTLHGGGASEKKKLPFLKLFLAQPGKSSANLCGVCCSAPRLPSSPPALTLSISLRVHLGDMQICDFHPPFFFHLFKQLPLARKRSRQSREGGGSKKKKNPYMAGEIPPNFNTECVLLCLNVRHCSFTFSFQLRGIGCLERQSSRGSFVTSF